jgi:predicted regulator of Ras-like GTPase activity (Roadblock/LC7/MglB family)
MVKKERTFPETPIIEEQNALVERAPSVDDLRKQLQEIQTHENVTGYILRSSGSASIDIKDPVRIIDYAVLSSSAFDASEELAKLFDLGQIQNIIVEGKNIKVLSLTIGDNRVSVFMEKNADCDKISRILKQPQTD